MFSNTLITIRESTLDLVLGAWMQPALNASRSEAQFESIRGPELAATLKRSVNTLKAAAIDERGQHVDYSQLRESAAYTHYRTTLTPQLISFDPASLTSREERLAFWINLYNALVIDAVIAFGVRTSVTSQGAGLAFFRNAAYRIGGLRCSLDDIEHGILRANRGNPFLPGRQFAPDDPRLAWIVDPLDPRIHFALNCASRSCPPIGVYSGDQIDTQLDRAAGSFIAADVVVDPAQGEVQLSRIFDWYRDDFGGVAGIIELLRRMLPDDERRAWLREARGGQLIYRKYDWGLNEGETGDRRQETGDRRQEHQA